MNGLKRAMGDLLVDEPGAGIDVSLALAAGRSARRARRVRNGLVLGIAAVAVAVTGSLAWPAVQHEAIVPIEPGPAEEVVAYTWSQELWTVGADGSGARPVGGRDAVLGANPDWSPDRQQLVFTRDDADGTGDIWVVDRDGANERRLVDCQAPCTYAEDPAWSPDGKLIAYWTNGSTDTTQVVKVADASTGEVSLTVLAPEWWAPVHPRWSPDGRSLAVNVEHYVADGSGQRHDGSAVGLVDLTAPTLSVRLLTPFSALTSSPVWSPSGDRILFVAGNIDPLNPSSPGASNLYTVRPDGSGLLQLTHRGVSLPRIAEPDWTTAEPPILVVVSSPGQDSLAAMDADGTNLRELVDPATGRRVSGRHPRAASPPG